MATILLAEDHEIVRRGFRALIEQDGAHTVVAETGDGLEAVRLVDELRPDILVVDLRLPGIDGLEVTRQVHKSHPTTGIIVLSMHASEAYVVKALRYGARAYVLKQSSASDLTAAIGRVLEGERFFSKEISEEQIDAFVAGELQTVSDRYETLSAREREVLHLLAEGYTGPEVAEKLFLSPRTVDTHRANIMAKLGLRNQAELVRYAVQRGMIPEMGRSDGG